MPTFKDSQGREWNVTLSLAAAGRIESCDFSKVYEGPVSFLDPPKEIFEAVLNNTPLQFAIIWCIVKPQADKLEVDQDDFCESITGPQLLDGKQALWETIADFSPALKTSLSRLWEIQTESIKKIDKRLSEAADQIQIASDQEIDRAVTEFQNEIKDVISGTTSTASQPSPVSEKKNSKSARSGKSTSGSKRKK